MNPEWAATILVGLLAAAMAYVSFRLSTRQLRAQAEATGKAVDAQAYARAEKIYEAAIKQLNETGDRMRRELAALRDERDRLTAERDRLHDINDRLEAANQRLEIEIARISGHPPPG